jgi:DNA polymerase-3 subunit gamma/tau
LDNGSTGYIVLARKYRPQRFAEVSGQEAAVRTLQNALRSGRLAHAFLFSGPRGVGKTTLARLLARALNCRKGVSPEPCGDCESCREVADGRSLDVLEIDGASNNKVEEARQLRETVRYAPARDRFRVFIIDEVHMLSVAAFNALLKTLEEPPPHVKFILATTEAHKIPATILSRCQHHEFRRLGVEEIDGRLAEIACLEGLQVEAGALRLIARAAAGSLRDALSALDQVAARTGATVSEADARSVLGLIPRDRVLGIFEAASRRDLGSLLAVTREIFEEGCDPARFCEEVLAQARDLLVEKLSPAGASASAAGASLPGVSRAAGGWTGVAEAEERRRLAAAFSADQLVRLFNLFFDLEQRLRGASLPQVLFEVTCVKLVHLADLTPIEDLLGQLRGGGLRPQADAIAAPAASAGAGAGAARDTPAPPSSPPPDEPAADVDAGLRARFISGVHDRKVHLATFLESALGIERQGETLVIAFQENHGFFHDQILDSLPLLQEVAREILGPRAGVRVARRGATSAAPATAPPGPASAQAERPAAAPSEEEAPAPAGGTVKPGREELLERVRKEPIVQATLEIFGAQIVDVQEP